MAEWSIAPDCKSGRKARWFESISAHQGSSLVYEKFGKAHRRVGYKLKGAICLDGGILVDTLDWKSSILGVQIPL